MKTKVGLAVGMITVGLAVVVSAAEYNFYEQADKKGCTSLITERGQSDCAAVQKRKVYRARRFEMTTMELESSIVDSSGRPILRTRQIPQLARRRGLAQFKLTPPVLGEPALTTMEEILKSGQQTLSRIAAELLTFWKGRCRRALQARDRNDLAIQGGEVDAEADRCLLIGELHGSFRWRAWPQIRMEQRLLRHALRHTPAAGKDHAAPETMWSPVRRVLAGAKCQ